MTAPTQPRRRTAGPVLAVAVVVAAAVAAALVAAVLAGPEGADARRHPAGLGQPSPPAAGRVDSVPAVSAEAAVLARWDARRARAYARGDVAGLRALYLPGSAAAARDVAMLRSYLARGLRVRGLRMQLLAVEVREHRAHRIRLRVTDRVVGARAVSSRWSRALPADQPTSRAVTLVRMHGRWRQGSAAAVP